MKTLLYHGTPEPRWQDEPVPTLHEPGEAIVRISRTTICGTDLHILKGDVPTVEPSRTLGHDGIGIVRQIGPAVSNFRRLVTHRFAPPEIRRAYDLFARAAREHAMKVVLAAA